MTAAQDAAQTGAQPRERTFSWADPAAIAAAGAGLSGAEFFAAIGAGTIPPPPVMRALDFDGVSFGEGHAAFRLTPREFHYNPLGSVHGGVFATMADSACGCAVHTMLPAGVFYTSLDLSVKFLRPVTVDTGPITAEGTVVHLGRRTALAEARITDAAGKVYVTATSSCLLIRPLAGDRFPWPPSWERSVMAEIRVGTAGWTDKSLIESGWYPGDAAGNPEQRLRYYASQFPLVEVDSAYYALPAAQTAAAWAERTPGNFTFNVKAFSLFTQHPTPVRALPKDLREAAGKSGKDRVYLKDVAQEVADEAWDRFLAALEPLRQAGKLGAILLQFPPWFPIGRASKQYILGCAERVAPRRVCVEFRNHTWMTEDNQKETLDFLSAHQLPYVCVDEPQGYPNSIPPVLAATSDLAVVRLHGHSAQWDAKTVQERFRYRYSDEELAKWAGNVRHLAEDARETHVVFNNCYRDYAHVNAQQLVQLIGEER